MKQITIGKTMNIGDYNNIKVEVTFHRNSNETEEEFKKRAILDYKLYVADVRGELIR